MLYTLFNITAYNTILTYCLAITTMEFLFSADALINLEQAEILHKHQGINSPRKVSKLAYFKRLGWLGGLLPAYVGSSICFV